MTRPSHVVYPLPAVLAPGTRKLTRNPFAREIERTVVKTRGPGEILPMVRYSIVFP